MIKRRGSLPPSHTLALALVAACGPRGSLDTSDGGDPDSTGAQADGSSSASGSEESSGGTTESGCRGDVLGGGDQVPIVGSGVTKTGMLSAVTSESLTLEDQGASLTVILFSASGSIERVAVSITSVPEATPAVPYVFSPIFEVDLEDVPDHYSFGAVEGTPIPERVGTCLPTLWVETPGEGWHYAGVPTTQASFDGPRRYVIGSECPALTCGETCATGAEDLHCGACDAACDAACLDPGNCGGVDLGRGHAKAMRTDGSYAWWIDEGPSFQGPYAVVGVAPPQAPFVVTTAAASWTVRDLDVADGMAYWLERNGDRWAVRRSSPAGPVETLADVNEAGRPAFRLAVGGDTIVVMRLEPGLGAIPWSLPTTGGAPQPIPDCFTAPPDERAVLGLRVHGGEVFASVVDERWNEITVYACAVAGGNGGQLPLGIGLAGEISDAPAFLEVDEQWVYFALPLSSVYRVSRAGGSPEWLGHVSSAFGYSSFTVEDGDVYFGTYHGDPAVSRFVIARVTPELETEVVVDHESAAGLAWANGHLVWATRMGDSFAPQVDETYRIRALGP